MGDTTDDLLDLAHKVSDKSHPREMDMLLTAGERISMALVAMAVNDRGQEAVSFTGSQSGIVTDTSHTRAKILEVKGDRIREELARGRVVIVAGFQGVSKDREVTTLGRGGSDTTAVALAAALRAESCEIYTDVDGVFTADPRIVPDARKLDGLTYDEMLELASLGAKVLHPRSVEIARRFRAPIHVRSSFHDGDGTFIGKGGSMEQVVIRGIAHDPDVAILSVVGEGLATSPGTAGEVFAALAAEKVNIDLISTSSITITCIVRKEDLERAVRALHAALKLEQEV